MLDLEFSVAENGEITGFELGYISFYNIDDCTLLNDYNNQPIMIFLTISELLFGIADFVTDELRYKEIGSIDSSLTLILKRHNLKKDKKLTELYLNKMLIAKETDRILLKTVYDKSLSFCSKYMKKQQFNNSIKKDLELAFMRVREALAK